MLEGSKVILSLRQPSVLDHIDAGIPPRSRYYMDKCPAAIPLRSPIPAIILILLQTLKGINLPEVIGIIGVGNVGSSGKSCTGIGMRVLLKRPSREDREGKQGAVPANTCRRMRRAHFSRTFYIREAWIQDLPSRRRRLFPITKAKPVIINTSRGEIIETAIVERLGHRSGFDAITTSGKMNRPIKPHLIDKVFPRHAAIHRVISGRRQSQCNPHVTDAHAGISTGRLIRLFLLPCQPRAIQQIPYRPPIYKMYDPDKTAMHSKTHPSYLRSYGEIILGEEERKKAYVILNHPE